ncbi:dihydrolipoamide acetyltransferase family protein [Pseudomonas sp. Marseille-QA0892]
MTDMSISAGQLDITAPVEQDGTRATVRTWLKKEGDTVRKDEPVVELETDKVVVEVCAPAEGALQIVIHEGIDAAPGAVIGRVRANEGEQAIARSVGEPAQPRAAGAPESAGAKCGPAERGPTDRGPTECGPTERGPTDPVFDPELRLSPSVRRLLAEHGMDPKSLEGCGTGRGGRLTRDDVVAAIVEREQAQVDRSSDVRAGRTDEVIAEAPSSRAEVDALRQPAKAEAVVDGVTRIPHSSMRRRIAEHMHHSVTTAPHVTAVFEADFGAIMAHRKRHRDTFANEGINLTFTAYFVAAAVEAMRRVPEVNSRWHDDYLEVFRDINLGVGTALGDKGLIVPVIHGAQDLSLRGIASRLQALTDAARNGSLKPADVQGGTFTVSNYGVSGALFASPIIINQPQSAILGIGALEKRVVVTEIDGVDTFQARSRAYVSLTIDHRVIDGSQANAWLGRFVEVLEQWPRE